VSETYDLAVVGSAFAGSLTAMIARRLGRSVVLLERGRHPRFAIGESSTPLANLLLERLANRHGLPALSPFAKWGSWQRTHPEIGCGLKRGFTFYHHRFDRAFAPQTDRTNELMVAASPSDAIADTHWFRPDFDHFFQREAVAQGVAYHDEVSLTTAEFGEDAVRLAGRQRGEPVEFRARFVVDASGPRGFLHRALGLGERAFDGYPATQALYSHFTGVRRWENLFPPGGTPPFPPDDAALHHAFPGGWMWVLRFNNGLTSAGVSVSDALARELALHEGAPAWHRLLARLPSVARQFAHATPTREFTHLPALAFRSTQAAGDCWALLPSAAGFVDPLLSTGFTLTLLGVERLAALFAENPVPARAELDGYAASVDADLKAAAGLIGALHGHFDRPADFQSLLMLYFAAASFSETARRLERPELAPGFLLRGQPPFAAGFNRILEAVRISGLHGEALLEAVRKTVAPVDVGGWCNPARHNWYPVEMAPLFAAADRLGSSREEIRAMLLRAGVEAAQLPGGG
jgi:FADH2 O2-dependent halogenase